MGQFSLDIFIATKLSQSPLRLNDLILEINHKLLINLDGENKNPYASDLSILWIKYGSNVHPQLMF